MWSPMHALPNLPREKKQTVPLFFLFFPLSIVRSFACLRMLARSLAGSAPCALARVSHLCSRGARLCDRSLVLGPSSSRSLCLLGRSFGRPLVFLVARLPIRSVALSLIRLLTVSFVCSTVSWFACSLVRVLLFRSIRSAFFFALVYSCVA